MRNRRFKRRRKNLPFDETKHHRKPQSLGGRDDTENISLVYRYKHEAWHLLFDNLPAQKMFEKFLEFYDVFGPENSRSPFQTRIIQEWVRARKSRIKKLHAWKALFDNMSTVQIVSEINQIWIDPDYRLFIEIERTARIKIAMVK